MKSYDAEEDTCMRRGGRWEKQLHCTYAKGEPASSLRSQPGGKDGEWWVEDGTGVVGWLGEWNEQRKVGERHRRVCGTDTDNKEKPRPTLLRAFLYAGWTLISVMYAVMKCVCVYVKTGKNTEETSFPHVTSPVVSLGLWLSCDGVHDGILWVHANRCVVLSVNDSGLSSWTPHLNGLVGGQGRVFQSYGVEAGSVFHTVRAGGGGG